MPALRFETGERRAPALDLSTSGLAVTRDHDTQTGNVSALPDRDAGESADLPAGLDDVLDRAGRLRGEASGTQRSQKHQVVPTSEAVTAGSRAPRSTARRHPDATVNHSVLATRPRSHSSPVPRPIRLAALAMERCSNGIVKSRALGSELLYRVEDRDMFARRSRSISFCFGAEMPTHLRVVD